MVCKIIFVGLIGFLLCGCDDDKVRRFEKENSELKSQIQRQNLELQSKCSKDAKVWFDDNWGGPDKDKIFLDFSNHYNAAMNKCFIRVEYHFRVGTSQWGSWANSVSLTDVYENAKYGTFNESHETGLDFKVRDSVFECEVLDSKCKSLAEFSTLVQPYMNN